MLAGRRGGGVSDACVPQGTGYRIRSPVELQSSGHGSYRLHAVVVRSAAALGWDPGNDLIRVGDVAGFAVNAIRRVQANALRVGLSGVVNHFVDIGRAEILARVTEFFYAPRIADVGVVNDQVRGLVLFVLGAGVIEVGKLVESQLAIAFRGAEEMRLVAAIRGQFAEFLQVLV